MGTFWVTCTTTSPPVSSYSGEVGNSAGFSLEGVAPGGEDGRGVMDAHFFLFLWCLGGAVLCSVSY